MNIQEIITLIRSGSSNHDHREGLRQIEKAVGMLKKMLDETKKTPFTGRFERIARLLQSCLVDEAISELRRWQREDDENNRWLQVSDAPKDSTGNIIPSVYYGYASGPCSARGLIRHNGAKWEWLTCQITCHQEIGEGQSLMFCPIPEAPDVPR